MHNSRKYLVASQHGPMFYVASIYGFNWHKPFERREITQNRTEARRFSLSVATSVAKVNPGWVVVSE